MTRREKLRLAALVAWALATVLLFVLWGVPTKHDLLFLWLGLGMAAYSLDGRRVSSATGCRSSR